MATQTDNSSAFRLVAGIAALLLVAAAALVFLRPAGGAGGSGEVAAAAQSLPLAAIDAIDGDTEAFGRLESGVATLRSSGGAARAVELAEAILARRDAVTRVVNARDALEDSGSALADGADDLLAVSGSTAAVQRFQQSALSLGTSLGTLLSDGPQQAIIDSIRADTGYMRDLVDALGGAQSALDVAALDSATRESTLAPLAATLADVEAQVADALEAAGALDGLQADVDALRAEAQRTYAGAGATAGGGLLSNPLIPLGLIAGALLLIGVLFLLHGKSSVFEETAREQAAQNERNQQAILRLLDELGSLADGDLTVEATVTEDITGAIADSINYAIEKLRELVATINETSIMIDSASKQTENTAVHMAKAADNQSREIAAATESIVSMAGSIEEVSGNAERSSDVARHSVEVAHKGGEAVRRTIDGMNTIRETIQETSKRIKRLGESSQEIGNIVELINDIAEQTNILALNASIQASMAGEAGSRFRGGRRRGAAAWPSGRRTRRNRSRCWCARSRPTRTRRWSRWSAAQRTSWAVRSAGRERRRGVG